MVWLVEGGRGSLEHSGCGSTGIRIWIPDGNFSNSCFTVHAAGDRLWIVKDGGVYSDRAVKDAEQGEYRILPLE